MAKIGITGYRGKLGSEFIRQGYTGIDVDVTDKLALKKCANFDAIINCAAYTDVDKAERDIVESYKINTFSPGHIAEAITGTVVNFSTDYIFNGEKIGGYFENDEAYPLNQYGWSKYFGEVNFRKYKNNLTIRTTVLFDAYSKNFVMTVFDKLETGQEVRLPKDIIGGATFIPHLVEATRYCLDNNIHGVINISNDIIISRYDLGIEIAKHFGFDQKLVKQGVAWGDAKRGTNLGFRLDLAKAKGVKIYTLKEALEGLEKQLKEIRTNGKSSE